MCKVTISAYQLFERFPDEDSARIHIESCRWNGKPACPKCQADSKQYTLKRNGFFECGHCRWVYTVRVGTIFERSHVPLRKWLFAIYQVATARKGISSLRLSKEIGVTQKTAWFMLQRIREVCGKDNEGKGGGLLQGIAEIDETYAGGLEKNKRESKKLNAGRGTAGKSIVLGMRERDGKVKAKLLNDTTAETIQSVAKKAVSVHSVVCADEHRSCTGMNEYAHRAVKHSAKEFVDGTAHTNGIESVWAVLKRGFYGVYRSFDLEHLQRYLNEFVFRLNSGNVKIHTLDRIDAMLGMRAGKRLTFAELCQGATR